MSITEIWTYSSPGSHDTIVVSGSNLHNAAGTYYCTSFPEGCINFDFVNYAGLPTPAGITNITANVTVTSADVYYLNGNTSLAYLQLPANTDYCIEIVNDLSTFALEVKSNANTDARVTDINPTTVPPNYLYISGNWNGSGSYALIDDATMSTSPCCLHQDTIISTSNGMKKISDVKSGDMVFKQNGDLIEVLYNIKYTIKTNKFVKINKGALGDNLPTNDLFITEGHALLIDDREVECQTMINGDTINEVKLDNRVEVYALCCREKTGIITEGVSVMTWRSDEWEEYCVKNKILWAKY